MNPLPAMDSVRMLQGVGQRPGQRQRGDADAFRQAMQQHEQEQGAETGASADADAGAETPKTRGLQQQPFASRKSPQGTARHVDFLA